ncbi:MAG: phosphotransferase [Clostridia bacterium]|nr:phosphotransferase [Clostridia bacterium]
MDINVICKLLQLGDSVVNCDVLHGGNINTSYKVTCASENGENDYLLQRINKNVFKNPVGVMSNIQKITEYINAKPKNMGFIALGYNTCADGKTFVVDENGDFWRARQFLDCVCFDNTDNLKVIEQAGIAFGEFQYLLDGFDASVLFESIPYFHNTVKRYGDLENALIFDSYNRKQECANEIEFILSNKALASKLVKGAMRGDIPMRVTHNDTKCNNVVFDKDTFEALSVIDLDTIMPGITAYDFGDGARSICCTSLEDEKDLNKVKFDLVKFDAFTKGFLHHLGSILSKNELYSLCDGVLIMTIELALRFLEDYLKGDFYFKTRYPKQNLYRARCQIALAKDIISKQKEIEEIVFKYSK